MDNETVDFMQKMVSTPSPSGGESEVIDRWVSRMEPAIDKRWQDDYGNTVVTSNPGKDYTVGVFVHLDEVGYMVRHIAEDGAIYVQRLGGINPNIARGKRVTIHGRDGPVKGVFGDRSFHYVVKDDGQSSPSISDIWIDVGAESRSSAEAAGIHVGAPVTHDVGFDRLQDGRVVGRALDNKAGATAVAEAMRSLDVQDTTVRAVATVQEEIQHGGMKFFQHDLQLNAALVVDVTFGTDTPAIDRREHGDIQLGDGPVCRHGRENHPTVVHTLESAADERGVPIQHEPVDTKGGERRTVYETTDGAYLAAKTGVKTGFVGIPCRYIHSPGEIVDLSDLDATIDLLQAAVEHLSE